MKKIAMVIAVLNLLPASRAAVGAEHFDMTVVRSEIASVVFRHFMDDNPDSRRSGSVYFINIVDGDNNKIIIESEKRYKAIIKPGTDFLEKNGSYYDKLTGKQCTVVQIKIESYKKDEAVVTISWSSSRKAGGGVAYLVRNIENKWKIDKELAQYSI